MKWLDKLDIGRIWSGALKVLSEVGLQIANSKISQTLATKLVLKGDRVCFPEEVVTLYADEIRRRFGSTPPVFGEGDRNIQFTSKFILAGPL